MKATIYAENANDLERALQASTEKFKTVFNLCPAAMALRTLAELKYVDVNQAWVATTGYNPEEVIGKTATELNLIDNFLLWRQKRGHLMEQNGTGKVNFRTKSGEVRSGMWTFNVIRLDDDEYVLTSLIDTTEQTRIEREMDRLDRLNIIGGMAASIGHEVRNPMTTVRGFLQLFLTKNKYVEDHEIFQLMIEELDRANAIITDFLSLSKNRKIQLCEKNLNDIIRNIQPLLVIDGLRQGYTVRVDLKDIPPMLLDENDIRQMLLNLTCNAFEAMNPGGTVSIATYAENGRTVLAVKDTGTGIPQEVLAKLGIPFVTTKASGTGLGLPVCYRIAERHNAVITFETSNRGTTVLVTFKQSDLPTVSARS